jgi:hypothetical protein
MPRLTRNMILLFVFLSAWLGWQACTTMPSFLLVKMGSHKPFCPCWPQTVILLISASSITRITGMSHRPGYFVIFLTSYWTCPFEPHFPYLQRGLITVIFVSGLREINKTYLIVPFGSSPTGMSKNSLKYCSCIIITIITIIGIRLQKSPLSSHVLSLVLLSVSCLTSQLLCKTVRINYFKNVKALLMRHWMHRAFKRHFCFP